MAKYNVLKPFKDIYTGKYLTAGSTVEMTEDRFDEATKNLKVKHEGTFLELVAEGVVADEELTIPDLKAKLTELGIKFGSKATKSQLEALLAEALKTEDLIGEEG